MMYDVIVLGSGPAGLSAAITTSRNNLKTLIIEPNEIGGSLNLINNIKNYPGILNITGKDLISNLVQQAKEAGVEFIKDNIIDYDIESPIKTLNNKYQCKFLVLCSGAQTRKLNLDNESKFLNNGLSYYLDYKKDYSNKIIAIVGSGNTAIDNTIFLSEKCKEVYLIIRNENIKSYQDSFDKLKGKPNIKILFNSQITQLNGNLKLESIIVNNDKKIQIDNLFVNIGKQANIPNNLNIDLTDSGYIIVNKDMETSISHVFACGDIIDKPVKQILTACNDGVVAGTKISKLTV